MSESRAIGATLHQRIRSDLESRILSGVLKPGERIPFEHELCATYGCSRMTVNKVLGQLVEAGLIERWRKAGTFVRRPVAQTAVMTIPDIAAEIAAHGLVYRFTLSHQARRIAGRADLERLGSPEATQILHLTSVHLAGEEPFALEDRLLDLTSVPEAADVDFSAEPPGAWLVRRVPWSEGEHRISAIAADTTTAKRLAIAPGTACLVVRRRTFRAGRTITAVTLTYPGDRHELVARFTP